MQSDAVPTSNLQIAQRSNDNVEIVNNNNNNFLVTNSNSRNIHYNIQGNGIHIGNVQFFTAPPQIHRTVSSRNNHEPIAHTSRFFKKTTTICAMLKSTEPLSAKYLDIFAESFGKRWEQVPILLKINDLEVERMKVDYFNKGGSREVIYQLLNTYFQTHQELATIGWFTSFLWKYNFKETVYNVKERLKELKQIEETNDINKFTGSHENSEETYL